MDYFIGLSGNYEQFKMTHVLVSILTYNGGQKTLRTIGDVLSQELENISMRIILIDNCSTNGIVRAVREKFPSIEIMCTKANLGFSGGNNIAIDLASRSDADYVFILNDDVQLADNYIKEMVKCGQMLADVAILGSTVKLPDGHIQAVSGYLKPRWAGLFWENRRQGLRKAIRIRKVDAIQGSAFVLTKRAVRAGICFDERLFFGGEEYDLALWTRGRGLKCYVVEHVEVIHDSNQAGMILDRWGADERTSYYNVRNNIFVRKKYSRSKFEYIPPVIFVSMRYLLKGVIFAMLGRPCVLGAHIAGIRDGLRGNMGSAGKYNGQR